MTDATEVTHLSNNPPLVDAEALATRHKDAFVAATAILNAEAGLPAEAKDQADVERLTKHVKDARMVAQKLEAARTTEKQPFNDAANQVQGLFKPRLDKLDASKRVAESRLTAWNRKVEEAARQRAAEAARIQREEADRRMAAAAAIEDKGLGDVAETVMDTALDAQHDAARLDRVATGSAADLVRTSTEAGTLTSATSIGFEIIDAPALRGTLGRLADYFDQPSIEKAIRAYVKAEKLAGRPPFLQGVRFFSDSRARVR